MKKKTYLGPKRSIWFVWALFVVKTRTRGSRTCLEPLWSSRRSSHPLLLLVLEPCPSSVVWLCAARGRVAVMDVVVVVMGVVDVAPTSLLVKKERKKEKKKRTNRPIRRRTRRMGPFFVVDGPALSRTYFFD